MTTSDGSTAADILNAALGHMQDRAATYDKPAGERSMGATVDAFKAVTGVSMTEEQGWLFMALLKSVRSQHGAYRADSYEDGAAYFALAGEAAVRDRNGGWTADEIKRSAFGQQNMIDPADVDIASEIDDESPRQQLVQQNGEMAAEVYAAVDGAPGWSAAPDWAKWLAQDSDGGWYWFECPVYARLGSDEWFEQQEYNGHICKAAYQGKPNENWSKALQRRPAK